MRWILPLLIAYANAIDSDHPEILFCLFERTGLLNDLPFDDPPRTVNCGNSTYCGKITADYFTSEKRRTHIVLRGCDEIEVPKTFFGLTCQKEGCSEITSNEEKYQLCCCEGSRCNSSSIHSLVNFIPFIVIYLTSR